MMSISSCRSWLYLFPMVAAAALAVVAAASADDWPQWLGPRRDGVWREDGILERFPAGGPRVRWRTPIGSGFAGPAVIGNRVYVTDYTTKPGVRQPTDGFAQGRFPGVERVLCLDDTTGQVLWTHQYDCEYEISYASGPRTTPIIADGKVYTLGAMGDLRCLDSETGQLVWAKNLPKDFNAPMPLWGFACHPLLDGDRLITLAGGDGSIVVALHKDTGKELWRSLSAYSIGYAPPIIIQSGGTRQLIVWHAEGVNGVEPETGKLFWSVPFAMKKPPAMSIPTPRFDRDRLLVSSFYDGSLMLKFAADRPAATVVWQSQSRGERPAQTDKLHSVMPMPILTGEHIYGVCSYGQLRCLKADTGERVWETMAATRALKNGMPDESAISEKDRWANAFLTPHGDRYFLFNEHGDLIIAKLSAKGYEEIDRANILKADNPMPGRLVVWSHPAFAHRSVYTRNEHEIVCVSMER